MNIARKWVPEIRLHCPDVPIILVGTKNDLRDDPETIQMLLDRNMAPISTQQGNALAAEIGAAGYFETSAITQHGLKTMFDQVIRKGLGYKYTSGKSKKRSSWGVSRLFKRLIAV